MMSETVVNVQDGSNTNGSSNPRRGPTVKTEPGQTSLIGGIKINGPYFKSIPGIIKVVQLILGIICMICASPPIGGVSFFVSIVTIAFVTTFLWAVIYLLSLREAVNLPINWILSELLYTSIITVFYVIAFIVQLASMHGYGPFIAAGIFGILNTCAYGAGAYFLYLEWKSNSNQ